MPASLALEEALLKGTLNNEAYTPSATIFIGLSTLKPSEVTKKTTAKVFGESEPTEGNNWARIELTKGEWELVKGEGETGATLYKYNKEITFKKLTAGEYKLETFMITEKLKASEAGNALYFGKLTTPVTINSATTSLTIAAKALEVTAE